MLVQEFLAGANNMDDHFRLQPFHSNLPVLMGLFSVWNVSFLGYPAKAILPYCQVWVCGCATCAGVAQLPTGLGGSVTLLGWQVGER